MAMRLFLVYVLVELAVVVALASTVGFGWTVLLLVGSFALGLALAGSQVKRQIQRLQSGLVAPRGALSDGVLVALGTILTVIPGLVTSALGLLLLLPPTRALARPAVGALAARGLLRMPVVVAASGAASGAGAPSFRPRRGEYIDGEVLDVTDDVTEVEPPNLPRHTD
jgi:UPF0716 protein FxsA